MEFVERTDSVTIGRNSGISGLLNAIKGLLTEIPRVKELRLSNAGVLSYTWYAPADLEEHKPHFRFEAVRPYDIVRNSLSIREVMAPTQLALVPVMFAECNRDKVYPICFVVGTESIVWDWHDSIYGIHAVRDHMFLGLPIMADNGIPEDSLLLCAGYARTSYIEDTYCVYKASMEIPQ